MSKITDDFIYKLPLEEEEDLILFDGASELAKQKDYIEARPSKIMEPKKPNTIKNVEAKKDALKTIAASPFPWSETTGFIVPPGENIEYLAETGRLKDEELAEVMSKAKKLSKKSKTTQDEIDLIRSGFDTETISTDSVNDRFDNI